MYIQQKAPLKTIPDFSGMNTDSFSRLRVSSPSYVFDTQLTYDLQPLVFEPVTANGGGGTATVAHDATNRAALMTFTAAQTGCKAFLQTYECFRYQPGRSQQIFVTFCMVAGVANVLKFSGYSDGTNGIEFQLNGLTPRFALYSGTTHGNEFVSQGEWSIDNLNGLGPSKILLDTTKTQILVIDFQALYVGRVRIGFDIAGGVVWCHEFLHANIDIYSYIQSANLPIRCGMTGTGTVSTTMYYYCCSVVSEGGQEEVGGYDFAVEGTATAGNGARTHILSIQPKTTFNSIVNRSRFVLLGVDILAGANPILWELCLGDVISGTTTMIDVNATYSAMQYNILGTTSNAPAIVVATGYLASSTPAKGSGDRIISARYPITLDQSGAARAMGRYTMLLTGVGGTSASRVVFNWREIR